MSIQLFAAIVAAVVLTGIAVRLVWAWWKFRGQRVITCPENQHAAGVRVDARYAAATALGKTPELRLSACSRWPEKAGCGQECLSQVAANPEDCLVHSILVKWYQGKSCAWCHRPIGEIVPGAGKPALLLSGNISVEWNQISADKLHETLEGAMPMCFGCHLANTLVREHPELVVDRPQAME